MNTKLLIYFFITFGFIPVQFAQVNLGVLGGINSTTINGDSPPDGSYTSGYGYNLGAIIDVYLVKDIAINLQPMYAQNSTYISYEVNYQYEEYDSISIKTEYIELPINIKILADNKTAYVTAGVSLAQLLEAKLKNQRSSEEISVEERFESLLLKANFGVGIQFSIGVPIIFFELNYSQSLTNISNDTFLDLNIDSKLKSNGIRLYTGIKFKL